MNDIKALVETIRARQASRSDLEAYEKEAKIAAKLAARERLEPQGVPARVRDTLLALAKTPARTRAKEWAEADCRAAWCLVLAGPPGTGKSTAAGAFLWHAALTSRSTQRRWVSAIGLATMDRYSGDLEKLCQVQALVIDDLGTEFEGQRGHVGERLELIFTEREAGFRRTMITTNLSSKVFHERYSKRIVDRIRGAEPIGGFSSIGGKSMR